MRKNQSGILVIEVLLAIAIFSFFAVGFIVAAISALNANRLASEQNIALTFATEGVEAVRSIKNQSFNNLVNTTPTTGVGRLSSLWGYSGINNTFGKFTRSITVSDVFRDLSGNIVSSGGSLDSKTKKITSKVTWNFNSVRAEDVTLSTYLTNFKAPILATRNGILVYGDGGTTTDAMRYKIFDGSAGTWSSPVNIDFDPANSNRALRTVQVYSSATRNEKIVLSRHYNGTSQYIYAHVFNGATFVSTLFTSWQSSSFLDQKNFDGDYLSNGNFMAIYSDNTSTPKYRIWNGSVWGGEQSLINLANNSGGIPNQIVTRTRYGTNEVMAAFFDQNRDTNTEYFNGSNWTLHSIHAANSPNNTKEMVDFVWSTTNSTKGALFYSSGRNDHFMSIKIWTANGSGSGSWSSASQSSNQGTIGGMAACTNPKALTFVACDKDTNNDIYCFNADGTPTFGIPSNNIMTNNSSTGSPRSFDIKYEPSSGDFAVITYSDNTSTPKIKKYNPSTNSFDANPISVSSIGSTLRTVLAVTLQNTDDMMILMANNANGLYTVMWNGTTEGLYVTPAGKAVTLQSTNGSANSEYWYGFAWDKN